jgi:hypothetical protein
MNKENIETKERERERERERQSYFIKIILLNNVQIKLVMYYI